MRFNRASGILLHPTSLPGNFGIGDFGNSAFEFIDFLAAAGQTYWQILPLGPTGHGNSPYSAFSAFAGNTLLISPEKLVGDGLLSAEIVNSAPRFAPNRVDYEAVRRWKKPLLDASFENFQAAADSPLAEEFDYFCRSNAWWLDDYALFSALKSSFNQIPWNEWAEPLRLREKAAVAAVRDQLARAINAEKFFQYLFFRQWLAVKSYARQKSVQIIGDIPIFVAFDSADVWCNREKFKLNPDGTPQVVAGVPPDYFSKTGQLWGNPIYDWEAMRTDNFDWWTARLSFALMTADIVRLDHFIGFSRNWEVPGGDQTAENGTWVDVPGGELFVVLQRRLGDLTIIAEDLGAMTPEVEELRDSLGFPGMRILQYGFGGDAANRDLPHNYIQNCVAYTGTHDNDTATGWYKTASRNIKSHCRRYLASTGREINWQMIRSVWSSVADTAIVPAQDLLGLDGNARMNRPGTADHNWDWRLQSGRLNKDLAEKLLGLTQLFGRTRAEKT